MKKGLLLVLFLMSSWCAVDAQAQNILVKYLNYMLKDTSEPAKPKFIAYPTVAFAPETNWEFGLSALLVYRANEDPVNRLSEIKSFSFVTLERQYGTWLDHALYTDKNKYFFLGEWKIQTFPLAYYGIGPNTRGDEPAIVNNSEIKLRQRVLQQVATSIFTGIEFDFQRLSNVGFDWPNQQAPSNMPRGSDGSTNLSVGWGILYDNIHNVLNPRNGNYLELAHLRSSTRWGSTFNFNKTYLDLRHYQPVRSRNVLALHGYGQFTAGDVPFNELALMGGDRLMRGYYLGRYRDKNLLAAQAEYRMLPFSFAKRWGASVFAGAGTVFPSFNTFNNRNVVWSAGLGPRFLLFPKKDVYNRLDIAFTSEGMGYYFFIGEAF